MQNTATPLVLEDSPISRQIKEMARSVTGQQELRQRKKVLVCLDDVLLNAILRSTEGQPWNC